MLIFIDESGDTGRKFDRGSSRYFLVSLILFADYEEALACDRRIDLLRHEIGKPANFEFHFANNSHKVRLRFLEAVRPYNFVYFTVVIDKDPKKLWGSEFEDKDSFYKYACNKVFTSALPYFKSAIVVIDRSGSPGFRNRLAKYLRNELSSNGKVIKKIKQQRSRQNNLLQLADYVTGIINRKVQSKKNWKEYYRFISDKENWVQIWPK